MTGVLLVSGPPSAGVTSMVEELRRRIPESTFSEARELSPGETPAAVVFVVSAQAAVTESDCVLAERATAAASTVVAVVSKVDDHRGWPRVLEANRARLAEYVPRFEYVPWVGAAAAPRLGEPFMDRLVALLDLHLNDPKTVRRNCLLADQLRLRAKISRLDAAASGVDRNAQVATLLDSRDELLRQRLLLGPGATTALRSRVQQARVALTYSARKRCATARVELLDKASGAGQSFRWGAGRNAAEPGAFERGVRRQCLEIVADVDDEIATVTWQVAVDLGLADPVSPTPPAVPRFEDPRLASRRLETQLMTVLGTGFGLGIALLVSRLFAGVSPRITVAGLVAGAVVGLAVTVWVVRTRRLLAERAVLERWVKDVISTVRSTVEERVATRVLAAESALLSAQVVRIDAQRRVVGQRIAAVDAELSDHARKAAHAESIRELEMPLLLQALQAGEEALAEQHLTESVATDR